MYLPFLYLFSSSSQSPQVWLLEGLGWSKIHLLAQVTTAHLSFPNRLKA